MPGVLRTGGLVCSVESTRVRNHRYAEHAGIPCTMVLTVSFVLFPVTGLFCHRPPGALGVSAARRTSLDPKG